MISVFCNCYHAAMPSMCDPHSPTYLFLALTGAFINLLRQFGKLHPDKKQISVGFIGYPNSGKSSVINTLKSKKVGYCFFSKGPFTSRKCFVNVTCFANMTMNSGLQSCSNRRRDEGVAIHLVDEEDLPHWLSRSRLSTRRDRDGQSPQRGRQVWIS